MTLRTKFFFLEGEFRGCWTPVTTAKHRKRHQKPSLDGIGMVFVLFLLLLMLLVLLMSPLTLIFLIMFLALFFPFWLFLRSLNKVSILFFSFSFLFPCSMIPDPKMTNQKKIFLKYGKIEKRGIFLFWLLRDFPFGMKMPFQSDLFFFSYAGKRRWPQQRGILWTSVTIRRISKGKHFSRCMWFRNVLRFLPISLSRHCFPNNNKSSSNSSSSNNNHWKLHLTSHSKVGKKWPRSQQKRNPGPKKSKNVLGFAFNHQKSTHLCRISEGDCSAAGWINRKRFSLVQFLTRCP